MTANDNPFIINQELYIGNSSVNIFANSITLKVSEGLTLLDRLTGSNIGDMTENGGLSAAFDGDANATFYTASVKSNTASAYVGKTLAAPSAIIKAVIYASQLVGYSSSPEITAKLYVKTGSAPANSVDGTLVGELLVVDANDANPQEIVSNNQISLWDHVWITTEPSESPAYMHIGEVEFFGYPGTLVAINSTCIVVGNSSVNCVINSTFTGGTGNVVGNATPGGSNTYIQFNDSNTLGGSIGFIFDKDTNTVTIANTLALGANVALTTTDLRIGNTSVNGSANSIFIGVSNSTSTATLSPTELVIGNTTVNTSAVSADTIIGNTYFGDAFISDTLTIGLSGNTINSTVWTGATYTANNAAYLGGLAAANYANTSVATFSTSVNVGANVQVNTTALSIGNSTVNTVIEKAALDIANSSFALSMDPSYVSINTTSYDSYLTSMSLSMGSPGGDLYMNAISSEWSNTTTGTEITLGKLFLGNSSINLVANSTTIHLANSTYSSNLTPYNVRFDAGDASAYIFISPYWIEGSNATHFLNIGGSAGFKTGNSSVNVVVNSSLIQLGNTGSISIGNSTVNTVIDETTTYIANSTYFGYLTSSGMQVAQSGAEQAFGIVQPNQVQVGNNSAWATLLANSLTMPEMAKVSIGNSSINLVANSTSIKLANSTSNTYIAVPNTTAYAGDYFLHANGSWAEVQAGATPGGSNTYVQYNDSTALGGSAGFTFDETTNNVLIANTVTVGNSASNVAISPSDIKVGNSSVNGTANSIFIGVSNSTSSATLSPGELVVGNSIVNTTTISADIIIGNTYFGDAFVSDTLTIGLNGNTINSTVWTGLSYTSNNSSYLGGLAAANYANTSVATFSTSVNVGSSLQVNTSHIKIGTTSYMELDNESFILYFSGERKWLIDSNEFWQGNSTNYIWSDQAPSWFLTNSTAQVAILPDSVKVGNSSLNLTSNSTVVKLINATSNASITAYRFQAYQSGASGNWVITAPNDIEVGNGSMTTFLSTGGLYVSTDPSGRSVSANSDGFRVGNSSINVVANSSSLTLSDSTANTITIIRPTTAEKGGAYYLKADGTWAVVTASPGGGNTYVQYNDSGALGGTAGFTYNETTNNVLIANALTVSASVNVGANVQVNTTALFIGNTTVNGTANAVFVGVSNSTGSANLTPIDLKIGVSVVNSTVIAVGANVIANVTTIKVANSIVNTTIGNNIIYVGNSTANVWVNSTGFWGTANNASYLGGTAAADYQTEAGLSANVATLTANNSTNFAGQGQAYYANVTSPVFSTSVNSAAVYVTNQVNAASHTVGTAVIANSIGVTTTGFVNAATVVNSAAHTIGSTLIANTLGVYHTGTINAASHTVGTAVVANSLGVTTTGFVNATTVVNSAAHTIGSTLIANTLGVYHTGVVNAATLSAGAALTANSTLVNTAAINVTGRVNTATFYATTTANVGAAQINTTALIIGSNYVNATNFTGISNNTLYVGSVTAANVVSNSQLSSNLANYVALATADQTITGGARITVYDLGNLSGTTKTPDPGDRPMQKITNNGAGTIAPGTNYGNYILDVINTTGAGAVTVSGWSDTSGDSFTTTTTDKFRCYCSVTADGSLMQVRKIT